VRVLRGMGRRRLSGRGETEDVGAYVDRRRSSLS
jgi:hypothetical protein